MMGLLEMHLPDVLKEAQQILRDEEGIELTSRQEEVVLEEVPIQLTVQV
jgi:hypothetical protein